MATANRANCLHESISGESGRWGHTGDYLCNACGELFTSKAEWKQEREKLLESGAAKRHATASHSKTRGKE